MKKFQTGNVVENGYGHILIIYDEREDNTVWVSFDTPNCSGVTRNETYTVRENCMCSYNNTGCPIEDCFMCHGKGRYEKIYFGMDKAKLLAPCVKDYILKRLTKNFNWG
jgi:hypothetical protein